MCSNAPEGGLIESRARRSTRPLEAIAAELAALTTQLS